MGFFGSTTKVKEKSNALPIDLLHEKKCLMCTLNHVHNKSPKMPPTGSNEPILLVLAEAPGSEEDIKGEQLVGPSGQLFRPLIPEKYREHIRWDNVCRCRPPNNRTPTDLEMEACRPFHVSDVEATRPFAIFGLGNVPLQWATNQTGITKFRGRYLPIKVGNHTCWYFPFFHPSALLRQRRINNRQQEIESEDEFATRLDLQRAFELIETLPEPKVYTEDDAKHGIICVTGQHKEDLKTVTKFLEFAAKQKHAGLDYETQNLRPYEKDSRILTISVSVGDETLAFAFEHPQSKWTSQQLELVRQAFVDFLLSPCAKICHNLSFEEEWTALFFGCDKLRSTAWHDTMVQAYVLDERSGCLSLDFLCLQYFGIQLKALNKDLNRQKLYEEPLDKVLTYNGMDAKFALLLFEQQQRRIIQEKLEHVYAMQLRRIPTIVLTQIKGLPIDFDTNKRLAKQFSDKVKDVTEQIKRSNEARNFKQILGREFNPGSPRDVEGLLSKVLNTRIGRKENNRYSTDEDVLKKVDKPITRLVLEYRKATKAFSTYIEPFDQDSDRTVIHDDGLIHTSFNTTFVTSGRLSSDGPNLQNQPKRDSAMKEVRSQFVPK